MKKTVAFNWTEGFKEDIVGQERNDPTLREISDSLKELQRKHQRIITVKSAGKSVGGNEIPLVAVTDKNVPDTDKQIAFFTGGEHGNEHSATTCLLEVLKWLVAPENACIRSRQKILIMPCVNPDGYNNWRPVNMNGVNLFNDFSLKDKPSQPESAAVWKVLEEYQPEVFGSCHGHWRKVTYAAAENCQGSYATSRYDRTHSRLFAEEVSRACEKAGYPQDRMEEDAEMILASAPGFDRHSFRFSTNPDGITPGVYAYHRFHTLVLTMEIMHEKSGLIKIGKILQLGNKPWRYEKRAGYPVRMVSKNFPFGLAAYGRNFSDERKSRIELWQSNDTITRFALPHIEDEGFKALAFSILPDDRKYVSATVSEFLDRFSSDRNIDISPLRHAFGYRTKAWWQSSAEILSPSPVWLNEIKNGIRLRARLLPGSRIKRVLINGRAAKRSDTEGYETWTPRNSYKYLQINIPPGKSIASPDGKLKRAICTVEYEPPRTWK